MKTGQMIRRIRQAKGVTQWQLSQTVGVSPARILLIERGDRDCPPELLAAIAKALNVREDALRNK